MLNRANTVTNQPYVGYDGPRIAGFSDDQLAGFDMVRDQAGQNQLMDAGQNWLQGQISGHWGYTPGTNQYAGQNPYLQQMIDNSTGDITRAYNNVTSPGISSAFSSGGAYGGSAHAQAVSESQRQLADQIGQTVTGLRSDDYNRQAQLAESALNRQQSAYAMNKGLEAQAMGMIPQFNSARYDDARALMNIGQQQQNLYQGVYDQGYDDFRDWRDYDANQLGVLANALGAVQGGTASQTGANPNYRSAGQNAAGYAALLASLWG